MSKYTNYSFINGYLGRKIPDLSSRRDHVWVAECIEKKRCH